VTAHGGIVQLLLVSPTAVYTYSFPSTLVTLRPVDVSPTVVRLLVCRCRVGEPLHDACDTVFTSPDPDACDTHFCADRPSLVTLAHFSSHCRRNRSSSCVTAIVADSYDSDVHRLTKLNTVNLTRIKFFNEIPRVGLLGCKLNKTHCVNNIQFRHFW